MCTAISLNTDMHYFGRNLDLDCSYGEEVCIMPRRFRQVFRHCGELESHFAMIGTAAVVDGQPLFFDAANECGLAIAGLNFPQNAYYRSIASEGDNIAPFELIPWLLGRCASVSEARILLGRINIVDTPFSANLPNMPLHWMLSDRIESLVIESMRDGFHIHENPIGILTNNPPFPYHIFNLANYRRLRVDDGEIDFAAGIAPEPYCRGLGALGLPGDVSSMSRFVRAAFGREHLVSEPDELSSVGSFFRLLSSVEMQRGCCQAEGGGWDITVYSSCICTDLGHYYFTTFKNRGISCVKLRDADLDGDSLSRFSMSADQQIRYLN